MILINDDVLPAEATWQTSNMVGEAEMLLYHNTSTMSAEAVFGRKEAWHV